MRVFVAGATGAIGRPLLTRLLDAGHEVTATTRSPERAAELSARGVHGVAVDALDAAALERAVLEARPEVVVNQLTALPVHIDFRKYEQALVPTNELRRLATPVLARAGVQAGARRLISQSIAFVLEPAGARVLGEDAPVYRDPPAPMRGAFEAVRVLEQVTLETDGLEGIVLRYGFFYGPGTTYAPGSPGMSDVMKRRFPILGRGEGCFSLIHVDDAAAATVLALDHGTPGIYHVTDDAPALQRDWVPALAAAAGAPRPLRLPVWVGRLAAGPMAGAMARLRGASNAKARAAFGWAPERPSYREGFPEVFGAGAP